MTTTGWFVVDRIARYRHVTTAPQARGQGAATTIIRHVQDHPTVRAQDALTIFCGEDGPLRLYQELGFTVRGFMWEFLKLESNETNGNRDVLHTHRRVDNESSNRQ